MYSINVIEKAFNEMNINASFIEFKEVLESEFKKEQLITGQQPKIIMADIYNIFENEFETEQELKEFIEEQIEDDIIDDYIFGDELSDNGEDGVDYFKIGDKIYELSLRAETVWCGDWSVRANIVNEVTLVSYKEITNYEVVSEDSSSIRINIIQ